MSMWIILAAAIVSWMFGAAWYVALSKPWIAASGFSDEQRARLDSGKQSPLPYILSFVAEVIMALVLALIIRGLEAEGVLGGVLVGATCWLGFVATTLATNNAYGMRRASLTAIDAAHWFGVLAIQGAILGYFAR